MRCYDFSFSWFDKKAACLMKVLKGNMIVMREDAF